MPCHAIHAGFAKHKHSVQLTDILSPTYPSLLFESHNKNKQNLLERKERKKKEKGGKREKKKKKTTAGSNALLVGVSAYYYYFVSPSSTCIPKKLLKLASQFKTFKICHLRKILASTFRRAEVKVKVH